MKIFILSLIAPFVAVVLAYLALREQAAEWPPAGAPDLPRTLWFSTLLIVAMSGLVHWALVSARRDQHPRMRRALVASLVGGCLFMGSQGVAWADLAGFLQGTDGAERAFASTFYILTGLHGAHVLGGIALSVVVTVRAYQGKYWSYHHPGVLYHAMYWHFLDGVWVVLFVVLEVGSLRSGG